MASQPVSALPADGGASFIAGWGSAEVAVAALGVFVVFGVVATLTSRPWPFDVAFVALVAGGLLVTWPVMVLMSGAAVVAVAVIGFAHKLLAPKRAAEIDAQADELAEGALNRLRAERDARR